MKIALFGASGNTGLQLAEQALARGHQVTALVRDPSKLSQFASNQNFKVFICNKKFHETYVLIYQLTLSSFIKAVKCNILDPAELAPHLEGQECVLSALGAPGIHIFRITLYTESMKSIVTAMKKVNLKRLLCVTSFYTKRRRL